MPRFVNPVEFYNDEVGAVLPEAQLFFFINKTTTPKATFADPTLNFPNAQPVEADGAGRFPNIWLEPGAYTVELRDNGGVVQWKVDDVNLESLGLLASTVLVFSDHNTLKLGNTIGGEQISFELGQTLGTQGYNLAGDGGQAIYVVVSSAAGTPDDILFLDLGSNLLAQRLKQSLQHFDTGPQMATALWLGINDNAITYGQNLVNDGNGGIYQIVPNGTGVADGLNFIDLNNGNQARRLTLNVS